MAFGRYVIVGAVATCFHYFILLLMVESGGLPAPVSAASGAFGGALLAYGGNRCFTFGGGSTHVHAMPRFMAVAVSGAVANGLIVWAGTRQLGMHYLLAQVLATVLVLVVTFRMNRAWTFKP